MSTDRTPTSRLAALGVLACLLVATVAGCGSDAEPAAERTTTTAAPVDGETTPPADEDGPVTIEHRYGSTEVAERPQRIVALDGQWVDTLIALDAPPVAYLSDYNVEGGNYPWREDGLDDATAIEATDALPYELIKAQQPDLIVVAYFAQDEAAYEALSDIAPTIATLGAGQVDRWQEIAEVAGRVLREEDAAADLVADVDGQIQELADELPGLEGKTYALVNYVPADKFYIVADPEDGADDAFEQLGMSIAPSILEIADDVSGRAEVSFEEAQVLDADLLLLLSNDGDPEDIVGYDDLPAVERGAVANIDYLVATGVNTPSPLSLPYALVQIRPALEKAAAA